MADTTTLYASYNDVTSRWISSAIIPDQSVINAYLSDATDLIDAEFPTLADAVTTDTALARRARLVCTRMVMRVLTNPDMLRQVQETTGPYSGGYTYAAETLSGLYLSDDDRALLSTTPSRSVQAFTIDPTPTALADTSTSLFVSQIVNAPEVDD